MVCPICRENHGNDRGLSFDSKGVNSCGMYRERLATLSRDCPPELGHTFAAAPAMLAELHKLKEWMEDCCIERQQKGLPSRDRYDSVVSLIAQAEGKQ